MPESGMIDPGQHFHQGGFSRAVFPYQTMDFASFEVKADIVKRLHTREGFADAFHDEYIFIRLRHACLPFVNVYIVGLGSDALHRFPIYYSTPL